MRHVYVTLQYQTIVRELLQGRIEDLRSPFYFLLYDEAVSWMASQGASTHKGSRSEPARNLPFVPGLGPLRLSAKAQVEHRAFGGAYGEESWEAHSTPSSPTGTRLIPRTAELVSDAALSDTYVSPENLPLSRRMRAEGNIDRFVSRDQSTWHVAFSVEPRRRIDVVPMDAPAQHLLSEASVFPRAYVHVYPYGGLTVTLGISVVFDREVTTGHGIEMLKLLTEPPRGWWRVFAERMRANGQRNEVPA
jgi:hypothetical protein